MILKNYLFSQVLEDYQQYTTDYSETFLKQFCNNCFAPDQIAIHRNGNLIYYAYAHKNSASELYGICIVCGEICLNLQWLYEYFQKVLDSSANKGILFRYNEQGEIRKNVNKFSSEVAEVDNLFREIREYVNKHQSYWEILPPEDFSIPVDSKISFAFNEDEKGKITDAIRHYHNVVVTMDSTAPSSFAKTVERLNSEKSQLQEEKNALENEIESLSKQKKQYKWVVVLSILVVTGLIAILLFNQNVNQLNNELAKQEYSVDSLKNVVSNKDSIIYNQTQEIRVTKNNLRVAKEELDYSKSLLNDLSLYMPISASNMEVRNADENYGDQIYSSRTTYIYPKLTVYSLIDGSVDLYTKFYTPNGLSTSSKAGVSPIGYSYKDNISLSKNQSTTIYLSGWGNERKGNWGSGLYRIEVWYNDVCIKAKSFRIY